MLQTIKRRKSNNIAVQCKHSKHINIGLWIITDKKYPWFTSVLIHCAKPGILISRPLTMVTFFAFSI